MGNDKLLEMIKYYDERAGEYDEVYFGKIPRMYKEQYAKHAARIAQANRKDVKTLSKIAGEFGYGHLIDIACGTGFWLQYYAKNCTHMTLIDQSKAMLRVCRQRINELGFKRRCSVINGDFFKSDFSNDLFDSAFIGFLVSHLSLEKENCLFSILKGILKPNARILIFDSTWSPLRKGIRAKKGYHERILNDGRKFAVYKRYFTESDVTKMFRRHGLKIDLLHMGKAFFAAMGKK